MLTRENIINKNALKNCNGFNFKELSNISKINIRGNSKDNDFITNIEKTLEIHLPTEPNTSNANDKINIIWLSPDEWLIEVYEIKEFEKILSSLNHSLSSGNFAITDVTENRTILRLSGEHLYKLLSKFMIIDLNKALKNKKSVAQTIFIKVPVLIVRNDLKNDEKSIDLHTNRSHAQYIIDLLIDGSKNINF